MAFSTSAQPSQLTAAGSRKNPGATVTRIMAPRPAAGLTCVSNGALLLAWLSLARLQDCGSWRAWRLCSTLGRDSGLRDGSIFWDSLEFSVRKKMLLLFIAGDSKHGVPSTREPVF